LAMSASFAMLVCFLVRSIDDRHEHDLAGEPRIPGCHNLLEI
jgi:hypothetical protein